MIPKILLPFNAIKALLNAAIVLLFYKPLSKMLKKMRVLRSEKRLTDDSSPEKSNGILRTVIVSTVAAVIIVASLLIVFLVLRK